MSEAEAAEDEDAPAEAETDEVEVDELLQAASVTAIVAASRRAVSFFFIFVFPFR